MQIMTYFASVWQERQLNGGLQQDGITVAMIYRLILATFMLIPPWELLVFLLVVGRLVESMLLTVATQSFYKS